MIKINSKDVKPIIKATFPDYRKRAVYIYARETISLTGLNWDGGSRNEYQACTIDGIPLQNQYDMSVPAPWNNPFAGQSINIPPGMVVVRGGISCGKQATLGIYVNPVDMPKYITE